MNKDEWLKRLRSDVAEVSVEALSKELNGGKRTTVVVDVREGDEYRAGHLPSALHLPRGFLELQAENKLPDREAIDVELAKLSSYA